MMSSSSWVGACVCVCVREREYVAGEMEVDVCVCVILTVWWGEGSEGRTWQVGEGGV